MRQCRQSRCLGRSWFHQGRYALRWAHRRRRRPGPGGAKAGSASGWVRQAKGHHAAPARQLCRQVGCRLGQRIGDIHPTAVDAAVVQPAQQGGLQSVGDIAVREHAGLMAQHRSLRLEGARHVRQPRRQHQRRIGGALKLRQQVAAKALVRQLARRAVLGQLVLQLGGQQLAQHGAAGAYGVGHLHRRAVMAGEDAPQIAVDDQGHAHGRADLAVMQVMGMKVRHAAQRRQCHVQRCVVTGRGLQRHRRTVSIRNVPRRVQAEQATRFGRYVGFREALSQARRPVCGTGLGHHLAAAVALEVVGQDAVKTQHAAQRQRALVQQTLRAGLLAQSAHHQMQCRAGIKVLPVVGAGFEFDQRAPFLSADKAVKVPTIQRDAAMIGQRRIFAASFCGNQAGAAQPKLFGQRAAERGRLVAQQLGRIGTQVGHNAKAIQRDQHAVGLNRARRVKLGLRFEQRHRWSLVRSCAGGQA